MIPCGSAPLPRPVASPSIARVSLSLGFGNLGSRTANGEIPSGSRQPPHRGWRRWCIKLLLLVIGTFHHHSYSTGLHSSSTSSGFGFLVRTPDFLSPSTLDGRGFPLWVDELFWIPALDRKEPSSFPARPLLRHGWAGCGSSAFQLCCTYHSSVGLGLPSIGYTSTF
ncbi:hypothetical protein MKZ38_001024 [Zalerion maritima]|uniref:Uncharacterized protein n=1 Tax=Zalerion maritima TaxID=339359 RepID=A0AAD5RS81_9PEZI|nr:hypothetical protein MKZ38_001024 [Zalerion maritima]